MACSNIVVTCLRHRGSRRKSDITGSIVSISEQSIKDVPSSNLASAIQGQGAGIDIQRSGANSNRWVIAPGRE